MGGGNEEPRAGNRDLCLEGCFPSHGKRFGGSLRVSLLQHLTAILAAGWRTQE